MIGTLDDTVASEYTTMLEHNYEITKITWMNGNRIVIHKLNIPPKINISKLQYTESKKDELEIMNDGKVIYNYKPLKNVIDVMVFKESSIWICFIDGNRVYLDFNGNTKPKPTIALTLFKIIEINKISSIN